MMQPTVMQATPMTPKQRAITALTLGIPDQVPTFELEFQLEKEMFGKPFIEDKLKPDQIHLLGPLELERAVDEAAAYAAHVYEQLDYCILPSYGPGMGKFRETGNVPKELALYFRFLKERVGSSRLLGFHGDGTFGIPDGNAMYGFAYAIADDLDGVLAEADALCRTAIERNKRLKEAGIDVLFLCSDYCYNMGPFVSPDMFSMLVTPYLARIVEAGRSDGLYMIKHTDGNIMPILDQLVACRPHGLHSLDPMAGVDIRKVKEMVGDQVCLCGNVHCAALQTGTDDEVRASARYCLTYGKAGGGYIFCTSNVPFKGMDPARYRMILDIWKEMRAY